jgi:hypothetical protein
MKASGEGRGGGNCLEETEWEGKQGASRKMQAVPF